MPGNLPGNFAISDRKYCININKDENRKSSFMKVEALARDVVKSFSRAL